MRVVLRGHAGENRHKDLCSDTSPNSVLLLVKRGPGGQDSLQLCNPYSQESSQTANCSQRCIVFSQPRQHEEARTKKTWSYLCTYCIPSFAPGHRAYRPTTSFMHLLACWAPGFESRAVASLLAHRRGVSAKSRCSLAGF